MNRLATARPATKHAIPARIALAGPAGSGKTYTALLMARELAGEGGKVLVIDTENRSASLYADLFDFTVIEWTPPYDPRELARTVQDAANDYSVVVVDSLSHFWMGEGGTLGIVDGAAARARGNSFAGWKEGTPAQNEMVGGLQHAASHVIVTMRSKTEYVLEQGSNGRTTPRKVGMAPVQRDGIEYEFTVTADLDYEHTLTVDKSRCPAVSGKTYRGERAVEMVRTLKDWLDAGDDQADPTTGEIAPPTGTTRRPPPPGATRRAAEDSAPTPSGAEQAEGASAGTPDPALVPEAEPTDPAWRKWVADFTAYCEANNVSDEARRGAIGRATGGRTSSRKGLTTTSERNAAFKAVRELVGG